MDERSYWLGFSVFPGIGPKRLRLLLDRFGTAKAAWEAGLPDVEKVIGKVLSMQLAEFRKTFSPAVYEENLRVNKVDYLILQETFYPQLLQQISNPPIVLFIKGDKKILPSFISGKGTEAAKSISISSRQVDNSGIVKTIAIVGTRKITSYGKGVTERITQELVAAGFVIVSGLAYGVDACAHRATIESGGKTIAVLGCGVDCCSPRENSELYNRIISSGGCIVSEYPLGAEPTKGSFPSRNRIIAGLSQAVIVTEGAADSGALYTAGDALKINRPVFAVPGPITSHLSKGPNSLIANGAKLVTGSEDILSVLGTASIKITSSTTGKKQVYGDTKEEQQILELLKNENLHFDELLRKMALESSRLGTVLSIMEMKGILKSLDGGKFGITA